MMIDSLKSREPYANQEQILSDFTEILDLHLYYIYKYRAWVCPDDKLRGLLGVTVSREEFEGKLLESTDLKAYSHLDSEETAHIQNVRVCFKNRLKATIEAAPEIPIVSIGLRFGFDYFEFFVLCMLVCCEINSKYGKLFAYLQDDISQKCPTVETAVRLFAEPESGIISYLGYFSDDKPLCGFLCEIDRRRSLSRSLALREQVIDYICGVNNPDFEVFKPRDELAPMLADFEIAEGIKRTISNDGLLSLIFIKGENGSGRRFQAKHCARSFGKCLVFVQAEMLTDVNILNEILRKAACCAILMNGAICITDFEVLLKEDNAEALSMLTRLINRIQQYLGAAVFITSKEKWYEPALAESIIKWDFEISETDENTRLAIWQGYTSGVEMFSEIDLRELSAKFSFSAGQIYNAVNKAVLSDEYPVSVKKLHECCYEQVVIGLDSLASPISPSYTFDDLVLPKAELIILKEACSHIKYRHTVYSKWNFGRKAAYGRGLSVLFSGPPGTGKTMAAQAFCNYLNMRLYKIQISQVVSKYIGETEKNLRRVFSEAKAASCVLFFDEMDALFGKRSDVKDAQDRHANTETAFLLQQMEEYDGVVLMATNLLHNIDEAFMRRIEFVINFPFPDEKTRICLWKNMLDANAPLSDDIDYDFLGNTFKIAGGNIKNCVIHAAFLAAAENSPVSMKHLVNSAVSELRKNNTVVLKNELKEYADMVFFEEAEL